MRHIVAYRRPARHDGARPGLVSTSCPFNLHLGL
jgi:hypothetical protein